MQKIINSPHIIQIFLFACVGLLSATSDTLITTASYRLSDHLALSVLLGYLTSLIIGYTFHKKFTFKSTQSHSYSLSRYLIAAVLLYFLSLLTVYIFMESLHLTDVLIPKLLSIPFIAAASFLIMKFWVFGEVQVFYIILLLRFVLGPPIYLFGLLLTTMIVLLVGFCHFLVKLNQIK